VTLFEGPLTFLGMATHASLVFVTIAIALAAYRAVHGPSLPDRVVGLDLIGLLAVSFIAIVAVASLQSVMFDAAIALALVSFLSTVAFARFIEWRGRGDA
jgi:multicomponent Na+:H+ antiporter subunit F